MKLRKTRERYSRLEKAGLFGRDCFQCLKRFLNPKEEISRGYHIFSRQATTLPIRYAKEMLLETFFGTPCCCVVFR